MSWATPVSTPEIALVVITDGRGEYLERTIPSLTENLRCVFASRTIIDDAGDDEYAHWLDLSFPTFQRIHHGNRRGLAAAVQTAWKVALDSNADYLWHHEEDFTLEEPIDVLGMARTLDANPHLAQLVLKRQAWSMEEIAAGGQMEVAPTEFTDCDGFVQHKRLFSLNPSLIPRSVVEACEGTELERGITDRCLDLGLSFAYWGKRSDPPRCTHIGARRSAGYRW